MDSTSENPFAEWKQPLIEAASLRADYYLEHYPNDITSYLVKESYIPKALEGRDEFFAKIFDWMRLMNHPICETIERSVNSFYANAKPPGNLLSEADFPPLPATTIPSPPKIRAPPPYTQPPPPRKASAPTTTTTSQPPEVQFPVAIKPEVPFQVADNPPPLEGPFLAADISPSPSPPPPSEDPLTAPADQPRPVDHRPDPDMPADLSTCSPTQDSLEEEMQVTYNIATSNPFQALGSLPAADEVPMPILFHASLEPVTRKIAELLPEMTVKPFLQFKKVFPRNKDEEEKVLAAIREQNGGHFRHSNRRPKVLKAVIKGLPIDLPADQLKDSISTLGFSVVKIVQFTRRRSRDPLPIYMVMIKRIGSFKDIFSLDHLQDLPISVEPYSRKAYVPQCFRCQNWGHLATHCSMEIKCRFCALPHDSRQCQKSRDSPPRCSNCAGAHTSSSAACPARPRPPRPARYLPPSKPRTPPSSSEEVEVLTIMDTLKILRDSITDAFGDLVEFNNRVRTLPSMTDRAAKMAAILNLLSN